MSSISFAPRFEPERRRSLWLVASVAANLIFAGVIISWVMAMRPHQPLVGWQQELMTTLPADDAAIVGTAVQRLREARSENDQRLSANYTKLHALLRTEPFDAAQANQVLGEMNAIRDSYQAAIQQIFAAEVTALSPAGRGRLAAAMEEEGRRVRRITH